MGGVGGERVALPLARRETRVRMKAVFRWVRTSVHPDCDDVLVEPCTDLVGDDPACNLVVFRPDVVAEGIEKAIKRRVETALMLRLRKQRVVVAQGALASVVVEGDAEIVDRIRPSTTFHPVFVVEVPPDAGDINLGEGKRNR